MRPRTRDRKRTPLDTVRYDPTYPSWVLTRPLFKEKLSQGLSMSIDMLGGGGRPSAAAEAGGSSPGESARAAHCFSAPTLEDFTYSPSAFGCEKADLRLFSALLGEKSPENIYSVSRTLADEPFFADCSAVQLEDIARFATHAYFPPHATIFSAGTVPENIYLILRGTVAIERAREHVHAPAVVGFVPAFFEGLREASATAVSHVHAMQINIADLKYVLRSFHEERNATVGAWLAALPVFAGWSRTRIQKLLSRAVIRNLRVGEVVTVQGDPVDAFFFVRRGELEVRRKNHVPSSNRWPASTESVETAIDHALRRGLTSVRGESRSSRSETPGSPDATTSGAADKVGFVEPSSPAVGASTGVGFAAGTAGASSAPSNTAAASSNLLPPELAGTYSGELLTTRGRGDPSLLRLVTSKSRLAALASQTIGLPLLPIPLVASTEGPHPHATTRSVSPRSPRSPPSPRSSGWGAGMAGGTIAYSPEHAKSTTRSPIRPRTTFIDTERRLPVGVSFLVRTSNDIIGKVVPGALIGLSEATVRLSLR